MSAGPPPWQGQAVPEERTEDGRPLRRTKHGLFVEDEPGKWCPYITPADELRRVERSFSRLRRPAKPWSPWDV